MIVLTATPPETVQTARQRLQAELSNENKAIMVVRGPRPVPEAFADHAEERAADQEWREVVWVQDSAIFAPGQEAQIYGGHEDCCGAAWSRGATHATLQVTALPMEIEMAFLKAEAA